MLVYRRVTLDNSLRPWPHLPTSATAFALAKSEPSELNQLSMEKSFFLHGFSWKWVTPKRFPYIFSPSINQEREVTHAHASTKHSSSYAVNDLPKVSRRHLPGSAVERSGDQIWEKHHFFHWAISKLQPTSLQNSLGNPPVPIEKYSDLDSVWWVISVLVGS